MKKLITLLCATLMLTVGCWSSSGGGGGDDTFVAPVVDTPTEPTPAPDVVPEPEPDDQDYTPQEPTDPVYDIDVMIPAPHADYNKKWIDDTLMCWAVASCDALANAGYATNEDWCMYEMMERYDDVPGYTTDAVLYWFELTGYNYVPAWQEHSDTLVMDFITDELDLGMPVIISMHSTVGPIGHAITAYGYTYVANSDGPTMYVLKIVDGDDYYSGVVNWGFYWNESNNRWECYDRDFYLSSAISLDPVRSAARSTTVPEYAPLEKGSHKVGR